ncbi:L-seryl-tRNA(Ser) seleniumtransferase [Silvibacterium bohemicum]|uniref:L-seryl-tRNA(Sec) selenium transferase n=1 Tax=Silvibacterium bohemicum TaxID=1577686 RepID=A0A841JPR9_9BACT|nr:L-seryl-tRNA(Sec) selenium transferase [Silvibacterium bohemicum]MBB6143140.1 L-seryl-tRNA(Ser) seleniumtransferase [Silvibacterium bohemicum]
MKRSENTTGDPEAASLYSLLPSINRLLLAPEFAIILQSESHSTVVRAMRDVLFRIRQEIAEGLHTPASLNSFLIGLHLAVTREISQSKRYSLRRVINATGVILHTNLGRAPLSASALSHIQEIAAGYSNLELDLETGERSRRDVHTEELLLRLLNFNAGKLKASSTAPPRSAVVVNNCAAATFLALNSLAEGAEVIVSRGELVEIGGGFRIPEILAKSGARLREVGTTNRTKLADYESAISSDTGLILRVHQSNFSMEGFTERPTLQDLVSLGRRRGIPVFDDQGTGLVCSLDDLGARAEPTLFDSVDADLVSASGDKLLGGPQCGLLVGKADLIDRIRKNPLLRALRVDKLTYAALEATLGDYLSEKADSVPVVNMIRLSPLDIQKRCEWVADQVCSDKLFAEAVPVLSLIGGGTAPSARLQSSAVSLRHSTLQAQTLLHTLRRLDPPVIGRVSDDAVLLDLRTVEPEFDAILATLLRQAIGNGSHSSVRE